MLENYYPYTTSIEDPKYLFDKMSNRVYNIWVVFRDYRKHALPEAEVSRVGEIRNGGIYEIK